MLEENLQAKEGVPSGEVAPKSKPKNFAKTTRQDLLMCKVDYDKGNWKSLRELADRYKINKRTLQARITREKWNEKREIILSKIESKVESQVLREVDRQENYRLRLSSRALKYEQMLDASVSQLATTPEGVPQCEPADLDTLTRAELRVVEMHKVGLKLPPPSQDITTGGQPIGDSIISAIAKLRETGTAVEVSSSQIDRVLTMEVVE